MAWLEYHSSHAQSSKKNSSQFSCFSELYIKRKTKSFSPLLPVFLCGQLFVIWSIFNISIWEKLIFMKVILCLLTVWHHFFLEVNRICLYIQTLRLCYAILVHVFIGLCFSYESTSAYRYWWFSDSSYDSFS